MYKFTLHDYDEQTQKLLIQIAETFGHDVLRECSHVRTVFYKNGKLFMWGSGGNNYEERAQEVANIGEMIRWLSGAVDIKVKPTTQVYSFNCFSLRWTPDGQNLIVLHPNTKGTQIPLSKLYKIWQEGTLLR